VSAVPTATVSAVPTAPTVARVLATATVALRPGAVLTAPGAGTGAGVRAGAVFTSAA
jgi:hypothetical protein